MPTETKVVREPVARGVSFVKLLAQLNKILDDIPPASRKEASFEIDTEERYDGYCEIHAYVEYTRPETLEETLHREKEEKEYFERRKQEDIAQLKKLKARYPTE